MEKVVVKILYQREFERNFFYIVLYFGFNIVVCFLQVCNFKYLDYDKIGFICVSENINDILTQYRWLISVFVGFDGVISFMREVDFDIFFILFKMIILDFIYFQFGFRVQCAVRVVNVNGNEGLELMSFIVIIGREEGNVLLFLYKDYWDVREYYKCLFLVINFFKCFRVFFNIL